MKLSVGYRLSVTDFIFLKLKWDCLKIFLNPLNVQWIPRHHFSWLSSLPEFPPPCLGHGTLCWPLAQWHSSSSPAPHSHGPTSSPSPGRCPMSGAGAALLSPSSLLVGGGTGPGTRLSPGSHSALTVTPCVLPCKAFSMNLYCLSFFLKYSVA